MKVIGHRGASGTAPENTLSSIRTAIRHSADFVEVDVRLTKDGIPVIFHDRSLQRTTNIPIPRHLHNLTFNEIKHLEAGSWFDRKFSGEKIPTLDELLRCDWSKTGLMLEIKSCKQSAVDVVEAVVGCIAKQSELPPLVIGSFSVAIVEEILKRRHLLPAGTQVVSILEATKRIEPFVNLKVDLLAIWNKLLTPSLVSRLHKENIKVWSFTVNERDEAQSLANMGIDGLITNFPEKFKKGDLSVAASPL